MAINENLLQNIPDKVGVYILKDKAKNVLYVGKALSLKNRVRKHFLPATKAPREVLMREKTEDVEFLVTNSEAEALILENNLIKQYSPPYNIRFKDDKSYPSLKVTLKEDYPAISVTREFKEDGSRYFGPYASAWGIRRVARYAQRLFGVRNCTEIISPKKLRKPCLNYQIGMCSAPCAKKIDEDEYRKSVNQLCLFLEGEINKLVVELEGEMKQLSASLEFEKAALVRDRLYAVKKVTQRQRVSKILKGNMDVIGTVIRSNNACIQQFYVRDGNLVGADQFVVNIPVENTPPEVLLAFIEQRYFGKKDVPSTILLSHKLAETGFITGWFKRREIHSKIITPMSDLESELIALVLRNAEEKLLMFEVEKGVPKALTELMEILGLDRIPLRIEGIDVSNIGGEDAVGSLVTFFRGRVDKNGYRRYRIKAVKGIDDYAMIKEVVRRRYKRLMNEEGKLPDLLLIDGGRGHLGSAAEELELMDVELPVISIAKKKEEVYAMGEMNPLDLEDTSEAVKLLIKIRNEAHRFAINYHKKLRLKKTKKSLLNEIPGIGEKKRNKLLTRFGSIEKIRKASVEEIAKTPLISKSLAQRIYEFLKDKKR